jgi:RimJ/RimL family protein N-acetyltransferase
MPTFSLTLATVREVRSVDASPLATTMAEPTVRRFVATPSLTVEDVSRFITWVREERQHERLVCFAVVPHDAGTAAGVFQMWPVSRASGVVEIGFAIDRRLWGTGVFMECAQALITFAIDHMGVHRIEARASVDNARGLAALAKLGAVREGIMRQCFRFENQPTDYEMWSILADDWHRNRPLPSLGNAP